jgi:hypothetical protein
MEHLKTANYLLSTIAYDSMMQEFGEIVNAKIELAIAEAKKKEDNEKFISSEETRKLFSPSISINTLKAWTKEGLLTEYRFGRKVYYKKGEVINAGKTLSKYKRRAML